MSSLLNLPVLPRGFSLHVVLLAFILQIALLPIRVNGQERLRELKVTVMEKQQGLVVQASGKYPSDAMVFVYTTIKGLQFRSSMNGIDQTVYREDKNRYELLVQPIKQILFVGGMGIIEARMETINPQSKEILNFKVEDKPVEVSTRKGELSVTSTPEGARLVVGDIETAYKTPYNLSLPSGVTRIGLRKDGFESFDSTVQVRADEIVYVRTSLKANWTRLVVVGVPDDAAVYVDERLVGSGPLSIGGEGEELRPGRHTVRVSHPSYRTFEQVVYLSAGSTRELETSMQPLSGKLTVTSYPNGAEVYIDETLVGRTPFIKTMTTGSYEVTLRMSDHREETRTAVVVNGGDERIDLMLTRIATMDLVIDTQPSGARVTIDGVYAGETPFNRQFDLQDRSLRGNKKVVVEVPQFHPVEEMVSFTPSTVPVTKSYRLTRKSGRFEATSSPDRVQVFHENTYLGTTPFTGTLPVGIYEVTFVLADFKTDTATLVVTENITAKIRGELKRSNKLPYDAITFYVGGNVFRQLQSPGPSLNSLGNGDDLEGNGSGFDSFMQVMLGRNIGIVGMLNWSSNFMSVDWSQNFGSAKTKTFYERYSALLGPVLSLPLSKNFKWEFRYMTGYSGMEIFQDRYNSVFQDQVTSESLFGGISNRQVQSVSTEKMFGSNWRIGGDKTGIQLLLGVEMREVSHTFGDIGLTRNYKNMHYTVGLCLSGKSKGSK
ncbi:MAG: PEGA domain-containing protein [Bacteroidota bacterium]